MKSPLWIINSILFAIFILIIIFIGFSLKNITQKIDVVQIKYVKKQEVQKEEIPKPKDIKFIYEVNDLFGTYLISKEQPPMLKIPDLPNPPKPKPVVNTQEQQIQFLEPLPIKITGIISDINESKSVVTILNNSTKESDSYKVGDKILDAYILRIFPKKIITIRSNGQQDTIYMYPEDAEKEIKEFKDMSWQDTVQKLNNNTYVINKKNFVNKISSLAQLIDMLDVTTAFKNGSSIGCRIGNMNKKSVGYALGLQPGDIILKIENIEPTTTENRINIYNILSQIQEGQNIIIEVSRDNKNFIINYQIKDNLNSIDLNINNQKNKALSNLDQSNIINTIKTIKRNDLFNSSSNDFKGYDKYVMNKYGSRDSILKNIYNK